MQTLFFLLPTSALLAAVGMLIGLLALYRRRQGHPPTPQRLPDNGLRPPGYLLSAEIDRLNQEVSIYGIAAAVLPIFIGAAVVIPLHAAPAAGTAAGTAAAAGCAILVFCLIRLAGQLRARRIARLGYDGELAVGKALEALAADGYHVFHNVPADGFAIDHVVVGGRGVFTVETRTHPGAQRPDRLKGRTVDYNGTVLFFPRHTDDKTVIEAQRQAEWLSNRLELAAGVEVAARAVVAVFGWYVKRTSTEGIPVVNPQQIPSLFKYIVPRPLDQRQVERIADYLSQSCRIDAAGDGQ
jgi:hypothetical protein